MTQKYLCIYHGNCADGFGAAWCVRHALGEENVEFHAGFYQRMPPDVTGRNVIMVDFSYKLEMIRAMAKTARSILILDHHKSAADDLKGLNVPPDWQAWQAATAEGEPMLSETVRVSALFDMERSGAGIAWDYFHPGEPRPKLINTIEDRDLWKFELEHTREAQAALFSFAYDFELWGDIIKDCEAAVGFGALVMDGQAILRKQAKDIAELLDVATRWAMIDGSPVPIVNAPYFWGSEAGHELLRRFPAAPFAAYYWDSPTGREFGLRSDNSCGHRRDASEVAVKYGGGGHRNSAGFKLAHGDLGEIPLFEDWPAIQKVVEGRDTKASLEKQA